MERDLTDFDRSVDKLRKSSHSLKNKIARFVWQCVYVLFFRPSPRIFHVWRCLLMRIFGAKIGRHVRIYPSVKIWAPWNVELRDYCSIGDAVDLYSVGRISIGEYTTVSQYSVLCGATRDYSFIHLPLIIGDITIGRHVWICADVFVMPGLNIGDGTIVGVRSTVLNDLPSWKLAFGTPCRVIKSRELNHE